ncbi:uncharacterized protein F4812DRAFT_455666 [Daldinia caldariorum]|uniref:uncharacterized protein n=1 Tax=Daldinia caldariorum TaxID=326644 RepID=UPI002007DCE8|nr:uncharacterized protein F4812DRAFT_455666 [Daldinia caldariorum]KAI1471555.1 hypothetical protein F4812DRAFT_455666 [Daldinia caldariorum]
MPASITTRLPFSRTSSSSADDEFATLLLPPQTTPFTPSHNADCTLSVYCKDLTYADGAIHLRSGLACQAVNVLGRAKIWYEPRCFPDGYFTLFNNMYKEIDEGMGTAAALEEPRWSTLAYPGSACLDDWTTACVTAVTDGVSQYSQAWCCPRGSWTCVSSGNDAGPSVRSGRYCASVMGMSSTEVWMVWDPPYTEPEGNGQYSTWTAVIGGAPAEYAATVYHEVFPLQLAVTSSVSDMPSSTNTSQEPGGNSNSVSVLFGGVVVGIAIGTALGVLGALCGAIFLYRRRRKRRAGHNNSGGPGPSPQLDETAADKPEPEGGSAAQAKETTQIAELDAGASRSELNGSGIELRCATVSPLSSFGPDPIGSDGISPSTDSRHNTVFEMSG